MIRPRHWHRDRGLEFVCTDDSCERSSMSNVKLGSHSKRQLLKFGKAWAHKSRLRFGFKRNAFQAWLLFMLFLFLLLLVGLFSPSKG